MPKFQTTPRIPSSIACALFLHLLPLCAQSADPAIILYSSDFQAPAGELRGTDDWAGRDGTIALNGKGLACPASGKADGFAKRPLALPPGVTRMRLSARVILPPCPTATPNSTTYPAKNQRGSPSASAATPIPRRDWRGRRW